MERNLMLDLEIEVGVSPNRKSPGVVELTAEIKAKGPYFSCCFKMKTYQPSLFYKKRREKKDKIKNPNPRILYSVRVGKEQKLLETVHYTVSYF